MIFKGRQVAVKPLTLQILLELNSWIRGRALTAVREAMADATEAEKNAAVAKASLTVGSVDFFNADARRYLLTAEGLVKWICSLTDLKPDEVFPELIRARRGEIEFVTEFLQEFEDSNNAYYEIESAEGDKAKNAVTP